MKPNSTLFVRKDESQIVVCDPFGHVLLQGKADEEDGRILQQAIEGCFPGGHIKIMAGKYYLEKPLFIDYPCVLEGAGRATELVPPDNEFAIRVMKTERSPLRTSYVYESVGSFPDGEARLYGVGIRQLAISGYEQGRGLYLNELVECWFRDLWIIGTHDGAAIYIDSTVMECEFASIHCFSNGNPETKEASLVIRSQGRGDANNNLHFYGFYVQNNRYNGVEIGHHDGVVHPRLLFFTNCMFHSWLPPFPYDLINLEKADSKRGIIFNGCRMTAAHKDKSFMTVKTGSVILTNCILGAANTAIVASKDASVSVNHSMLHQIRTLIQAEGAKVSVCGNTIHDPCEPVAGESNVAIVSGNLLTYEREGGAEG